MLTRARCCCGETSSPCTICVTVYECNGTTPISGATVTVVKGDVSVGSCTTGSDGRCCVTVTGGGPGTYTVSVSKSGYVGSNKSIVVSCPGTTETTLIMQITARRVRFTVNGCPFGVLAQPLPGAVITVNGGTYVTDSSGNADFALPSGTHSYSVSADRFQTATGTVSVNCLFPATVTLTLTPASGYHCACNCVRPLPETLYLTDSVIGSLMLSWDGSKWAGATTYDYPGFCGCPEAAGADVRYWFTTGCGLTVRYRLYTPPPPSLSTNCVDPTNTAGFGSLAVGTMSVSSCSPGFVVTASYVPGGCGGTPERCVTTCIYQGITVDYTVTE